jgi:hypothetical protein
LVSTKHCNWERLKIYKDLHPKFGVHVRQKCGTPNFPHQMHTATAASAKMRVYNTTPLEYCCAGIATSAFIPPTTAPPNHVAPFSSPPQFGVVIGAWLGLLTPSLGNVVRRLDVMGWNGGKGVKG